MDIRRSQRHTLAAFEKKRSVSPIEVFLLLLMGKAATDGATFVHHIKLEGCMEGAVLSKRKYDLCAIS